MKNPNDQKQFPGLWWTVRTPITVEVTRWCPNCNQDTDHLHWIEDGELKIFECEVCRERSQYALR